MTPIYRPVGEAAVLVEFGDTIERDINASVIGFDRAVVAAKINGIVETVPAYATLLVIFDPDMTDHATVATALGTLQPEPDQAAEGRPLHNIPVNYGGTFGPDIDSVAHTTGVSADDVIAIHQSVEYRVYMGGFAPGYAYLGDIPDAIRIPRKATPQSGHPAGSVIIAGGQCLITTLPMPTGWWVIGHTDARVFDSEGNDPFLLKPGDRVQFTSR
jgi:inhibitor of KinA